MITTAYLTGKASFQASHQIRLVEAQNGTHEDPKERFKERARETWKLYIPAGVSAGVTVACILGAHRVSSHRTVAAQAAFALSERAYSEYRDKVVEEIGEKKEQAIRDEIAQDRVNQQPPSEQAVLMAGPGKVLCCEWMTRRYFHCDAESLRKAENSLNAKLLRNDYAYLDDFYDLIGLESTATSGHLGWISDQLMELKFSTVLAKDDTPCLVFDYNYTRPLS